MHVNAIGLICEYNPFHNGHIYHINKIKEMYPDSILVLIINGYFLERGEISLISKYGKTKLALEYGIDLVVSLPVLYGCQSADVFSYESVNILNKLKVNKIICGSESMDLDRLNTIADKQLKSDFSIESNGESYPKRLANSLDIDEVIPPNDLLIISYLKAIKKINPSISLELIKRTNEYHDTLLDSNIVSGENIRNKYMNNLDISNYVPSSTLDYIHRKDEDKIFNLLKYRILFDGSLDNYIDVTEGLDFKLRKEIFNSKNIEELINNTKSKRYTYNRIKRMLAHILLGILKSDNDYKLDYIQVLGFNNKGRDYLSSIKKDIDIPLNTLSKSKLFQYELKASLLYDLLMNTNTYEEELKNRPINY